jgi:hypothetical protein
MKLRHSLSGIEAFRCQTFVIRVTWIVCRRFALPGSQTNCECIVAALTDAGVKIVPPVRNNRGQCKVDQDIRERGPRLPIKIMSRRPATGSVTSKGPKSARSITGLYRSIDFERSAACSTDLPFLVATACLDLAADKSVAFGSCQCRLMIFVSTGGTIAGAGGTNASAGWDAAAWAEVS